MPEQSELDNIASAAASTPGQTIFKTEMFGFKRDEVLACIERMTSENLDRQKNLEVTISNLQEKLNAAARNNDTLLHKTKQVCDDLASEKLRADTAAEQVAKLRIELEKASDNVTTYRSQLAIKEQEAASLKADNVRLNGTVNSLTATISDYENRKDQLEQKLVMVRSEADNAVVTARQRAEAVRREAEAQAMVIKAKAEDEARVLTAQARQQKTDTKKIIADAADNIAASIVLLKSQLASVDEKINAATGNLQKATGSISAALENTEKDLVMLGVQMEKFPTPIPPIAPAPVPQPAVAPVIPEKVPVLSYTQSAPSQQNAAYTQPRAAYAQSYDTFDSQRAAYEAQQREAYNRQMQQNYYEQQRVAYEAQQRAAYEAQQRAAFEAQQRAEYEAQQRDAYARAQQEVYDRQVREAYERQMQAAFEQRQREMQEKIQREAYERQQREEIERQQCAAYEAQQRAIYEAQQRASYERSQREAYAQQTTGVYGQPHYPQSQPFTAFPQQMYQPAAYAQPGYVAQPQPSYAQQPVYDAPPAYSVQAAPPAPSAPLTGSYVPQPTPVAPAEVETFSAPPEQKNSAAQQPELATYTPSHAQSTTPAASSPNAEAPRPAAPQAPFTSQAAQPTLEKAFFESTSHAPVAPSPVAQQSVPFANQQAFSAPKEMQNMEQSKRTVQPRRTPPRSRATLSDALIDGLSNLLNK